MTTTKIIILAIIFGLSILFFWLAFRKKKPKKPIQDMPIYPHTPSRPKPLAYAMSCSIMARFA